MSIGALASLADVLNEANELVRCVHLIRQLAGVEILKLVADRRCHAVIVIGVERLHLLFAPTRRVEEPELVRDDPAAQLAASIPARVHRIAAGDAPRAQFVVDVVEFQAMAGAAKKGVAMELVAE